MQGAGAWRWGCSGGGGRGACIACAAGRWTCAPMGCGMLTPACSQLFVKRQGPLTCWRPRSLGCAGAAAPPLQHLRVRRQASGELWCAVALPSFGAQPWHRRPRPSTLMQLLGQQQGAHVPPPPSHCKPLPPGSAHSSMLGSGSRLRPRLLGARSWGAAGWYAGSEAEPASSPLPSPAVTGSMMACGGAGAWATT